MSKVLPSIKEIGRIKIEERHKESQHLAASFIDAILYVIAMILVLFGGEFSLQKIVSHHSFFSISEAIDLAPQLLCPLTIAAVQAFLYCL